MEDKNRKPFEVKDSLREAQIDRVFTIKDLDDISYRQLNDWDKKGLLWDFGRENEKSWRKFSIIDLVLLSTIKDLKKCLYSDEAIKNIVHKVAPRFELLMLNTLENTAENFSYIIACAKGVAGIGKGQDAIVNYHRAITELCKKGNLLNEGMLIIPIGLYYRNFLVKYYRKQLEIDKKSELNPLNTMPENLRQMVILDLIKDEDYSEILIKKQDEDFIIKPKCNNNRLSLNQIVDLLNKNDYASFEIKKQNGQMVHISKEETIKI